MVVDNSIIITAHAT